MAYEIELPDGRSLEFPEGMTQAQMSTAIQRNFPEFKKQEPMPEPNRRREIIGTPETPGTMAEIEPAFGSVEEAAKAGVRATMPYARPVIEAGTSVGAAVLATPATPAGQAIAGGLGYGIGKKAADIIEGWAQPDKAEVEQPKTLIGKAKKFGADVATETMQSAKDIAFGTTMEMGGQLVVGGISATAKFAMNKLKDIGKALPPLTRAGATDKAGRILAAQTQDGPLIAQNIAEAEALEEAIPGLKFSRGQRTNDPNVIKFERQQARMTGDAAQEQLEQVARNSKAIRSFMDEQKGAGGIEDVVEPLAKQEKAVEAGTKAAAGKLEKEGAELGGGLGAVETGETLRTAARAGKTAAQKKAGELFKEVPEFPIDAKSLISKIDELSAPINKFEGIGQNIPEEFAQYKKVLEDAEGVVTPQDLQGLRSNLTDAMRDVQGSASPNNRVISRLSKLIGEVDNVLKEAGGVKTTPQKVAKTYTDAPIGDDVLKTGDPVNVKYSHNKGRSPDMGAEFAQDIEPTGKYIAPNSGKYKIDSPDMEYGTAEFKNPIVLEHKTTRHGGWKTDLSNQYGGKTGKQLTNAVKKDGYDGIITVDDGRISESVYIGGVKAGKETKKTIPTGAAEKLKTAQQFFKKEVIEKFKTGTTGDILKKGAGGDKVSNAQIASRYFKPGSAGVEQANQFVEAVGDNPQARTAIEDFIKQDLLSTATNPVTGEIIESKLKTWLTRYKPSLKKLGLENRFNTIVKASEELNKAKDMQVAFNKSVASKMIEADVETAVRVAFSKGSKRKAAERLMFKLKGDKKAVSGLQNATIDHIITNAETTAVDAFQNPIVSLAGVEKEFKKLKPAIDVLFKDAPEKLESLNRFRTALKIMQRGKTSPLGGGSDSFENIVTGMAKASGLTHSRTLNIVKALSKPLLDMSDSQVNAILNRAAFDPEFAQTIMMAAKGRSVKIIEQRLKSHLAALGLRETFKPEGEK